MVTPDEQGAVLMAVEPVELGASRCNACGLLLVVPAEPFACERCGQPASGLEHTTISSTGVVIGHAVVYEHTRPEPPTPFVVVEVSLDAGPVVRSLLRHAGPGNVDLGDLATGDIDGGRFAFVTATAAS